MESNNTLLTAPPIGGARLVRDINPGGNYYYSSSSYPFNLTEFNGQLFFSANDGSNGRELWVSDGTEEGTQLLVDINSDVIFYNASSSNPSNLTEFNSQLFFTANDGSNGRELWISDGTREGTQLLININTDDLYFSSGSYASNFTEFNGQLFFTANDGINGNELWVSDGTEEGTQLLIDINPVSLYDFPYSSYVSDLTEVSGQLFFTANDGINGNELWVSDGTEEGTQLVANINPRSDYFYSSDPSNLTEFNGQLFFSANDGINGSELWVSDGTTEGTQLVADINSGNGDFSLGSYPSFLTEFSGQLFFRANNGINGNELWVTDGTTEGTQLLVDINSGNVNSYYNTSFNSYVSNFTEFKGQLFFTATNGTNGNELWISDGTAEGTQLLVDINPSSNYYFDYSGPSDLTIAGDLLFFTADDGLNGRELWFSDGTAEGTQLFQDINPGSAGSNPEQLSVVGDQLFFTANDGTNGRELWVAAIPDNITTGDNNNNVLNGTAGIDFINGLGGNDVIRGRGGNDVLLGGDNDDVLFGNGGNDNLGGGSGDDNLFGDGGDDTLQGESGNDTLEGGAGNDTIIVTDFDGINSFDGGSGSDTIRLEPADGRDLLVNAGTIFDGINTQTFTNFERIITGSGNDIVVGDDSADFIDSSSGDDVILGRGGRDTILGGAGDDEINGEAGADLIEADAGDDLVLGGSGGDSLLGGAGADELQGEAGRDSLTGGAGNDTLVGGRGADTLTGGIGDDILLGERGSDTFRFDGDLLDFQSDTDTIDSFQTRDLLDFSGYLGAGGSIETTRVSSGFLRIELSGQDTVNVFGNQAGLNAAESQIAAALNPVV